jgi:hypothetical protein
MNRTLEGERAVLTAERREGVGEAEVGRAVPATDDPTLAILERGTKRWITIRHINC